MPPRTANEIATEIRVRLQTTLPAVFEQYSVASQLIEAFAEQLAETERRCEDTFNTIWARDWIKINKAREEVGLPLLERPTAPWKVTK